MDEERLSDMTQRILNFKVLVIGPTEVSKTLLPPRQQLPENVTYHEESISSLEATARIEFIFITPEEWGQPRGELLYHGAVMVFDAASKTDLQRLVEIARQLRGAGSKGQLPLIFVARAVRGSAPTAAVTEGNRLAETLNAFFVQASTRDSPEYKMTFKTFATQLVKRAFGY